jgi:hypothetical protein
VMPSPLTFFFRQVHWHWQNGNRIAELRLTIPVLVGHCLSMLLLGLQASSDL